MSRPALAAGPVRTVAVADGNAARVWDLDLAAARDHLCTRVADEITRAQWRHYIGARHYAPPCQGD